MQTNKPTRKLEREIEMEEGDDYVLDLKKNFDIPQSYKYDIIPEFWEGHNIADFIDPDILEVYNFIIFSYLVILLLSLFDFVLLL